MTTTRTWNMESTEAPPGDFGPRIQVAYTDFFEVVDGEVTVADVTLETGS